MVMTVAFRVVLAVWVSFLGGDVVRVYRTFALIHRIVVVVIDSVLGFLLTHGIGMVIVIVGVIIRAVPS